MRHVRGHVRAALLVGLIGGTLLGLEQGLLLLKANAGIQIPGYVGVNLALALVTTTVASCLAMAALSLAGAVLAGSLRGLKGGSLGAFYASAFTLIAVGALGGVWLSSYGAALGKVGASASLPVAVSAIVWAALAMAAGAVIYKLLNYFRDSDSANRSVRLAVAASLLVQLFALWPLARFARENWRLPLLAGGSFRAVSENATAVQPNILLITIDTLRADRVAPWGGSPDLTPHLNQLAEGGVAFLTAISPSSWTLPAIASLMTGMIPSRHGAGWSENGLDILARSSLRPEVTTLAQALCQEGYVTGAIVTNPFLSTRYGIDRGFHTFANLSIESEAGQLLRPALVYRLITYVAPRLLATDTADAVTDRALAWLKDAPRPFLLWVHYIDPHPPYGLPAHVNTNTFRGDTLLLRSQLAFHDQLEPKASHSNLGPVFHEIARLRSGEIQLTPEQRRELVALYDAEVSFVDREVGRLLDYVDKQQTVVAVAADHGEEFWEHGGVEHGHTFYEEIVKVPWILSWPGYLKARKSEEMVGLVDLMPTLLSLLGGTVPAGVDGLNALKDRDTGRILKLEGLLFADNATAVRTMASKRVSWASGKLEAYDLAVDPQEKVDLAALVVRPGTNGADAALALSKWPAAILKAGELQ